MKFSFFLLVFSVVFFQTGAAQTWYQSYAPHGRDVGASAIPDSNAIVLGSGFEAAEEFEEYFLSNDYGLGWSVFTTDTPTSMVRSMAFKDAQNGYAVCYHGKITKTTDGGNNWVKVDTIANRRFFKVIYTTPQTIYIAGGSVAGDTSAILKSTDGGNSWAPVYTQPGYWLKSICFTNALNGFAVGNNAEILKTTNGGANWSPVTALITGRTFNGVIFLNPDTGFIIGGRTDTATATLLKTVDGGQNWSVIKDEAAGCYNDITFINASEGYVVGDSAQVLKTTNGGQSWVAQALPNTAADQRINTVSFYNAGFGVVGGMYGYVRIFANAAPPVAITLDATTLDASSVTLSGQVNTGGIPAQCNFYISTDSTFPYFTTTVSGTTTENNSLTGFVSSTGGLIPDSTYYYFLKVNSIAGIANGDTLSFKFTPPTYNYSVQTLAATNITSNSATVNAIVNKMPFSTNFQFEYGLTTTLGDSVSASPSSVNDTLLHTLAAGLTGLLADTTYYFRIKGSSGNVSYPGTIFSFNTSVAPSSLLTLPASAVSLASATLNGSVNKLTHVTSMSFEYGTTQAFGTQAAATPAVISDTMQHFIAANLSGLQGNTVYYYRIKGVVNSIPFYGNTLQFYTGTGSIPNWDFELWQQKDLVTPNGWSEFGGVDVIGSYNGSRAISLYGFSNIPLGLISNGNISSGGPPTGGYPFTARPDSFIVYANYNIATGDTAVMGALLTNNTVSLGGSLNYITGNTGGSFKRMAFPFFYSGPGNPDTMLVVFANTNVFSGNFNVASWMKMDDISFTGTAQNVANANFEDIDSVHYEKPEGWFSSIDEVPANLFETFPVTKTTDAFSGQYAIRMESVPVPKLQSTSAGYITTSVSGTPGFAVNYLVQSLNGYFKFTPVNNDTFNIGVQMYRNGTIIGTGGMQLDSLVSNYTPFSIPINYITSGVTPDSGAIYIRNCLQDPRGGSVLIIDDLGFDGFYAGINEVSFNPSVLSSELKVYPNPSSSKVFVKATGLNENGNLEIFDVTGTLMYTRKMSSEMLQVDVAGFAPGIYMIRVSDNNKSETGKLIIAW